MLLSLFLLSIHENIFVYMAEERETEFIKDWSTDQLIQ